MKDTLFLYTDKLFIELSKKLMHDNVILKGMRLSTLLSWFFKKYKKVEIKLNKYFYFPICENIIEYEQKGEILVYDIKNSKIFFFQSFRLIHELFISFFFLFLSAFHSSGCAFFWWLYIFGRQMNDSGQYEHLYNFSPVWVATWS